uniref:Uncharacterized protein n=1 Tax=Anguilla anguilla TaxID=7936 RepID=A0A0E9QEX2_ANGAN
MLNIYNLLKHIFQVTHGVFHYMCPVKHAWLEFNTVRDSAHLIWTLSTVSETGLITAD